MSKRVSSNGEINRRVSPHGIQWDGDGNRSGSFSGLSGVEISQVVTPADIFITYSIGVFPESTMRLPLDGKNMTSPLRGGEKSLSAVPEFMVRSLRWGTRSGATRSSNRAYWRFQAGWFTSYASSSEPARNHESGLFPIVFLTMDGDRLNQEVAFSCSPRPADDLFRQGAWNRGDGKFKRNE